jgi:hypothetical protein
VLDGHCLDEQVPVELVFLLGRLALLALLQELQVLLELFLTDLAAELFHVEQ